MKERGGISEHHQSSQTRSFNAAGPFIRDIVFGVHDALLTNIGIVTGFVTALQDNRLIVIAALIDVFISAFAMAFGTYLSRTSETAYLEDQLHNETHRHVESALGDPIIAAIVMWFTYVVAGFIPLLPFMFGLPPEISIRYAISLALIVFFIVGLLKGVVTRGNIWGSGLQFILFGGFAAAIGYLIGLYGQQFIY